MKEYIEPEVEIIEYGLLDIIASSQPQTSGQNGWGDPNGNDSGAFNENEGNDDIIGDDDSGGMFD